MIVTGLGVDIFTMSVAIQLFAEYNFWYKYIIITLYNRKVAIQLFAEYNFWWFNVAN